MPAGGPGALPASVRTLPGQPGGRSLPQTLACTALLWRRFPQTFQLKLLPTPCTSTQWPSAFPLNDTRASLMTCFVIVFSVDPFKFQRAGETSVQSGTSRVQLRN